MNIRSNQILCWVFIAITLTMFSEITYAEEDKLLNQIGSLVSLIQATASGSFNSEISDRPSVVEPQHKTTQLETIIRNAATAYAIDPELIKAIVQVESAWNPHAVSSKGAMGLMQLMPGTARDIGVRNPFDPLQNIYGGTLYYRYCLDIFGNHKDSLMAYNAGPRRIVDGDIPEESKAYANRIMAIYRNLKQKKEGKNEKD